MRIIDIVDGKNNNSEKLNKIIDNFRKEQKKRKDIRDAKKQQNREEQNKFNNKNKEYKKKDSVK